MNAALLAAAAVSLAWPVPRGWRTETIPFPLEFAPQIQHRGFEELRFAPGMFKPDAPDFFSYAFVWWLSGEEPPSPSSLQAELATYFRGLCESVGKGKYSFDAARFKARLTGDGSSMAGQVDSYDAFKTGKPITLNVRVRTVRCGRSSALVVGLSPAASPAPIWTQLDELRAAFRCPKE